MARNRDSAFRTDRTFNIINPIAQSKRDGIFRLSNTSIDKYKSNLYTLIFTGIGERVMEPNFGTILKYTLFEPLTEDTHESIRRDILQKTSFWIPEIQITNIEFSDELANLENNKVSLKIDFELTADESIQEFIEIEIGT